YDALLATLRPRAPVRTADGDAPAADVDVRFEQPAQLTLPQPREDRGREDRPLTRRECGEQRHYLFGREDVVMRVRNLARLHHLGGIVAEPLVRLGGLVERADDELSDVVNRLRRERTLLRLKQALDIALRDTLERTIRHRGLDDVALDRPDVLLMGGHM